MSSGSGRRQKGSKNKTPTGSARNSASDEQQNSSSNSNSQQQTGTSIWNDSFLTNNSIKEEKSRGQLQVPGQQKAQNQQKQQFPSPTKRIFQSQYNHTPYTTKLLPAECLQKEIDRIGFGKFQLLVLIMTGGVMFSEGSEMLVMGSITTLLHSHWDLSAFLRGLLVSIVFIGFCCGNIISGMIGDKFGRRNGILLSYMFIGVFGMLTWYSWNPFTMVTLRFLVGVGCGIGFPAVYALIPEVCPTKDRGAICTLMIGCMPLGELFAAIGVLMIDPNLNKSSKYCEIYSPDHIVVQKPELLDSKGEEQWNFSQQLQQGGTGTGAEEQTSLQHLGFLAQESMQLNSITNKIFNVTYGGAECSWRSLCEYSALPAFFFFTFCYFFLEESPHYLLSKGKYEELEKVLRKVAFQNGNKIIDEENMAEIMKNQHNNGLGSIIEDGDQNHQTAGIQASSSQYPDENQNQQDKPANGNNFFSWRSVYNLLTSKNYLSITLFLFVCHFTKDFSVFGLTYIFPKYFMSLRAMTPGVELTIVSLLAIPGVLLAFFVTRWDKIDHRTSLQLFAGLCAICSLGMMSFLSQTFLGGPCAYMVKFMALGFFVITVIYTSEVYPTSLRNSAIGVCTAAGRLGSISAPLVFELSHQYSNGSFDIFMTILFSSMLFIAAFVKIFMTRDTKGKALVMSGSEFGSSGDNVGGVEVSKMPLMPNGSGNAGNYDSIVNSSNVTIKQQQAAGAEQKSTQI